MEMMGVQVWVDLAGVEARHGDETGHDDMMMTIPIV